MTDWTAIKSDYLKGTMDSVRLGEKHGVSDASIRVRAMREGWGEERNGMLRAVTERSKEKMMADAVGELAKFCEDDLKISKALRGMVGQSMAAAQQSDKRLTPFELRSLASTAESAQRIGRLALGLTTGNTGLSNPEGGPVDSRLLIAVDPDTIRRVLDEF